MAQLLPKDLLKYKERGNRTEHWVNKATETKKEDFRGRIIFRDSFAPGMTAKQATLMQQQMPQQYANPLQQFLGGL